MFKRKRRSVAEVKGPSGVLKGSVLKELVK